MTVKIIEHDSTGAIVCVHLVAGNLKNPESYSLPESSDGLGTLVVSGEVSHIGKRVAGGELVDLGPAR